MSKIEILPEELANQIAAGEVIERPASVVKELVENSLDAGASRVDIQVEGSGTRLIRIIDNGCGMEEDDVLLSLERHATSKLTREVQLSSITTLGFRGEAIPTIASVARLSIISRLSESTLGTQADIRYGKVYRVHESGAPCGTVVEVRDLFGNVPARRKFLKTPRTEANHIEEVVTNILLSRVDLALTYELNGRLVHSFAKNDSLESRLRYITGKGDDEGLIPVSADSEGGDVRVSGYLLSPEQARPGGSRLRLFVNGRPVQDRMISHAVVEGMKGRRPGGALFISLPPDQVDVNVHPAKQEVRFTGPHLIHKLVARSVCSALEEYQKEIRYSVFSPGVGAAESRQWEAYGTREQKEYAVQTGTFTGDPVTEDPVEKTGGYPAADREGSFSFFQRGNVGLEAEGRLIYIGQFRDSYLLCEGRQGLVVIDQHAAHERLLYENLKKQFSEGKLASQSLLFPEVMECDPRQERVLEDYQEEIGRLGFEVQAFGGKSYVIKAVPAILSHIGPLEAVEALFASYLEQVRVGRKGPSRIEDVLAGMSCKAAVKANHHLQDVEGEELLKMMQEADIFSYCPHGRPVLKQFSDQEVEKWFYRS
ncbi:MAG: DNA mismatch repair endonuclease MutL [Thermodesulfobacteriota bacterium]